MRPASPMHGSEGNVSLAQRIRAEQLRHVYLHAPMMTVGALVAATGLVWTVAGAVPTAYWASWIALVLLHQCLCMIDYRAYRRAQPDHDRTAFWNRRCMTDIVTAGLLWGGAGVLLYVPYGPVEQTYTGMILFGIVGVTIGSLAIHAPAFHTLVALVITPFIVRTFIGGSAHELALGIPIAIASILALSFGHKINRLAHESIRRSFENLELIDELRHQKTLAEHARLHAEAANRSKTRFFAMASHDLRQPLHAMGLFTATLLAQARDPQIRRTADCIGASVNTLERLFNELLDLSRIETGTLHAESIDFPIAGVFDRLRSEFAPEATRRNLRLRMRAADLAAHADPLLVERMLRNLLSNALHNTPCGGILVGCRKRGDGLSIEVWDSGIGIAPHHQARIFDEFYQATRPEHSSAKGFGLGLPIVRRLAHLLDTEVELASRVGRGSVFRFGLPRSRISQTTPARTTRSARSGPDLRDRLIVIVDDEPAIVAGTRALLRSWGAQVISSANGNDVLARIHRIGRVPDLVIADYRLDMTQTGLQLIDRLRRELDPQIGAILLTGSTPPAHRHTVVGHDVRLLLKPVLADHLQAIIETVLRHDHSTV